MPGQGAGFLGMAHAPFVINNPPAKIANLNPPDSINEARMQSRLSMLSMVENNFAGRKVRPAVSLALLEGFPVH